MLASTLSPLIPTAWLPGAALQPTAEMLASSIPGAALQLQAEDAGLSIPSPAIPATQWTALRLGGSRTSDDLALAAKCCRFTS